MPVIAADRHEVADLERPQHQHERAGGEVPEHPAPGRADREPGAGQERGEGRRLDAEVAEDADDERDVQAMPTTDPRYLTSIGSTELRFMAAA